ncbi:Protein SMG7 [Merluccius polli]|uniref:Protein SMG7 n=1 Tax=Merluccius polli TaxID=89951 RepID=A0AA47MJD5_MERPO|nr:Protein SMG7 [Merluccius polli]
MTGRAHDVMTARAHDVMTARAHDVMTARAHDVIIARAHDVMTARAHDVMTARAHDVMTARAHDVMTARAHDVMTARAHDVVTARAHDVVTASAHDVVTARAHDVMTARDHDVMTARAHDVMTARAHDVMTARAHDVMTARAHDVITARAHDVIPARAHDVIACFSPLSIVSFLGVMCCRVLLNHHHQGELMGECPLPALKVSLDWLRLRPSVFQEGAVHQRQHVWPWLVAILNSFQPREEHVSPSAVAPLPEEFELQGFLALRPALRTLDFSKGHQGMLLDGDGPALHPRHHRLISLGRWIADTLPCLMRYQASDEGQLLFLSDLPEQPVPEPQERDVPVLQESSNGEAHDDAANKTLKSVLSAGRGPAPGPDTGERPVVTFKENIKPREQSRDVPPARAGHAHIERPRDPPLKAVGPVGRGEPKREGKRKCEVKRTPHDKASDAGKQVKAQPDQRKTPVSQPQTTCSSQFIPIHHPGAFPPLPSRPGFPPPAYVIPPPVPFAGLQVNPGFSFSAGVPGAFLQTPGPQGSSSSSSSSQVPGGKQSHIPYSQQRPSAPGGPAPGPGSQGQQSPSKPVQMGKSPPHIPGLQQQYMQVQDPPAPMWSQGQAGVQKMQMQPGVKQAYFLPPQAPAGPLDSNTKGMKFPDVVKMQEYYWEQSAYRMGGGERGLGKRPPPGGFCPEPDSSSGAGPRGAPFEQDNRGSVLLPELVKSLADLEETGEGLPCTKVPGFYQALAGPLSTAPRHSLFVCSLASQTCRHQNQTESHNSREPNHKVEIVWEYRTF